MNTKNENRLLSALEQIASSLQLIATFEQYKHTQNLCDPDRPQVICKAWSRQAAAKELCVDVRTLAKHCTALGITTIESDLESGRDDMDRLKESIARAAQKRTQNIRSAAKLRKGKPRF